MAARTTTTKRDLYAEVTESIIDALETAGSWSRPWATLGLDAAAPRNLDGRPYRGVNVLLLWGSAMTNGYTSGIWGTYKAYQSKGAQVRKGEHGTLVTLWKPFERKATAAEIADGKATKDGKIKSLLLRHFTVFAAEQVDGYTIPTAPTVDPVARDAAADEFFAAIGADVRHGGDSAAYSPTLDYITMPVADAFVDGEHYYATLAHEHAHWTGHASRLGRDMTGRFGGESYAMEELVAELAAAFVGAHLGFHAQVRDDHAAYVKNWVRVLRSDTKAIFTAASAAQKAADYLVGAASVDDAFGDYVATDTFIGAR